MDLSLETLCIIWFAIMGVLLAGYAILDGFDLGVGILHPFIPRTDEERRISMNSIGPIWDGNEVWLVVFGGAMFAMFPEVYASAFSGFYLAFIFLLFALIFRAISFDFRSKIEHKSWRKLWDYCFFVGSALATFLFGVAIGNILRGIDLTPAGDFVEGLTSQLNLFSILVGVLAVSLFAMHGSIFLYFKTEGDYQKRVLKYMWRCFGIFLSLYLITTIFALITIPHVHRHFGNMPILWIFPLANVLALANIPRTLYYGSPGLAFVSSCVCIISLVCLLGAALYPYMIFDPFNPSESITIFNGASSEKTLKIGLLFVVIGMPCVLAYSAVVYWTFRGKVRLDNTSY